MTNEKGTVLVCIPIQHGLQQGCSLTIRPSRGFVAKFIEEHIQKDKLWKVEMTVILQNKRAIISERLERNINLMNGRCYKYVFHYTMGWIRCFYSLVKELP